MIFVTVGTTLEFDALIALIDGLIESGHINEKIICQIGNGSYLPRYCEYFRFKSSIDELIKEARLVICHGGTGSTLDVLTRGKKFVAVANPKGVDDHQVQFLERLSQIVPILWTKDLENLLPLIIKAENYTYHNFKVMSLAEDLKEYIDKS